MRQTCWVLATVAMIGCGAPPDEGLADDEVGVLESALTCGSDTVRNLSWYETPNCGGWELSNFTTSAPPPYARTWDGLGDICNVANYWTYMTVQSYRDSAGVCHNTGKHVLNTRAYVVIRSVVPGRSTLSTQTPGTTASSSPKEVGNQIVVSPTGKLYKMRFWKAPGETGTHTLKLWNKNTGALLRSVTLASESASGWQEVQFTPLTLSGYSNNLLVSVNINNHVAYTANAFAANGSTHINTCYAQDGQCPLWTPMGYTSATPGTIPSVSSTSNYFTDLSFLVR